MVTDVPIELRRLDASAFPLETPTGLTFLGALELDLSGATSMVPLTLSLAGAASLVPAGSAVVVAEARSVEGRVRLVFVALARIEGDALTTVNQVDGTSLPGVRGGGRFGFFLFDGLLEVVSGVARDESGRRDSHLIETEDLAFLSVTDALGGFALVSRPGPFTLVATGAGTNDQARVEGQTGIPLDEIVIGPTPPRVEEITVRPPKLEGNFSGPIVLLGKPAPVIDDDVSGQSSGNGNGEVDPGERIELTLSVRNNGTVAVEGGFLALAISGPTGAVQVQPQNIPLDALPPDEPLAVGPFVYSAPLGVDPSSLRYTLAYLTDAGLANTMLFSLPLGVEHPNVSVGSEIVIRFSEPVVAESLTGAVTLAQEQGAQLTPVATNLIVSNDETFATLRPLEPLADDSVFRITLTGAIVDRDGRSLEDAPVVERLRTEDRTPPERIDPGQIEVSVPDSLGFVTVTGSPGSVNPDDNVIGLNETTGFAALADVNADGSFEVRIRAEVTHQLSLIIQDRNDNQTKIALGPFVRRDPITGEILSVVIGRDGGTFTSSDGVQLIAPEGSLFGATELSISRITQPFSLPADIAAQPELVAAFQSLFTVADRVRVDANTSRFAGPVRLALPAPAGSNVGDLFVVARSRTVTIGGPLADLDQISGITREDNPAQTVERLEILDSATVKSDSGQLVLSTDSPPFRGITEPGELTLLGVEGEVVFFAGEVRRDSERGPPVAEAVVRSLPDVLHLSPFATVTDRNGLFVVAAVVEEGPFEIESVVAGRLDVNDPEFARVIRRDVRGVAGPPAPEGTTIAHLEEPFVLPERLPPEFVPILGDLVPPEVEILIEGPFLTDREEGFFSPAGSPLTVTVTAEDNNQISFLALEVDQGDGFEAASLSPEGTFEITPFLNGVVTFRAQARDPNDNVTFVEERVRIVPGIPPGQPVDDDDITDLPGVRPELFGFGFDCDSFDSPIGARFTEPLDTSTINATSVQVRDPEGDQVDIAVTAERNDTLITISPRRNLRLGATYTVQLASSIRDLNGEAFEGATLSCEIPAPRLVDIAELENVEDVALVGDTVLAINHPDGATTEDSGELHSFRLRRGDDGEFEELERLASVQVLGRPYSLAVDGTRAYLGNRWLGSIATKQPLVLPFVPGLSGVDSEFQGTLLECSFDLSFTTICTQIIEVWNTFPQPASNLQVFDLSDPASPARLGGQVINFIPFLDIWEPNTSPHRVEITPQGVAVLNFLDNLEFFTPTPRPESLGVVGQIRRYGEFNLRGPDGVLGTADDFDNEFVDAAFFDGFAVTLVRNGVRIVSTNPLFKEAAPELAFLSIPGTFARNIGGVPDFEIVDSAGNIAVAQLAFIATRDDVLTILDVTIPSSPRFLGSLPDTFGNMSFDACRGVAYLHGREGRFDVVDFNDPTDPVKLNDPGRNEDPFEVEALGTRVSFNGNANRNGLVYLVGDVGLAFVHLRTGQSLKFVTRRACELTIEPPEAAVGIGGTQQFNISGGVSPYRFELVQDNSIGARLLALTASSVIYFPGRIANTTDTVKATDSADPSSSRNAVVTVYAVEKVEWVGVDPGDNQTNLDPNPDTVMKGTGGSVVQMGGGLRIFPGKNQPGSSGVPHREVKVRATISPKIEGVNVFFKQFDVDDPTDDTGDIDNDLINPGPDNVGGPGILRGDLGPFTPMLGDPVLSKTDVNGVAEATFTVTSNPGDNFRVVAGVNPDSLLGLQVPHPDARGSVLDEQGMPILDDPTTLASHKATPLLSVWRRLHVEVDSMGTAPPGTSFPPGDDDPVGDDVPNPDTSKLRDAFDEAYIEVVVDLDNGATPWRRDFPSSDDLTCYVDSQIKLLVEEPDYWTAYVIGIYEFGTVSSSPPADNDPPSEAGALGVTLKHTLGPGNPCLIVPPGRRLNPSAIPMEVIRDVSSQRSSWTASDRAHVEQAAVIHEIGHQFDLIHTFDGAQPVHVMSTYQNEAGEAAARLQPLHFKDKDIRAIRSFGDPNGSLHP